jgi:hypothetical protein
MRIVRSAWKWNLSIEWTVETGGGRWTSQEAKKMTVEKNRREVGKTVGVPRARRRRIKIAWKLFPNDDQV